MKGVGEGILLVDIDYHSCSFYKDIIAVLKIFILAAEFYRTFVVFQTKKMCIKKELEKKPCILCIFFVLLLFSLTKQHHICSSALYTLVCYNLIFNQHHLSCRIISNIIQYKNSTWEVF